LYWWHCECFGPKVQSIEKLTLLGSNCVDGDALKKFVNLTSFTCDAKLNEMPVTWLQSTGANLKSLVLQYEHDMMRLLPFCPNVEKISISGREAAGKLQNPDAVLGCLTKFCPKLRKLSTRVEFASNESLDDFLSKCTLLEELDILPVSNPVLLSQVALSFLPSHCVL
jgi:hypothetical protein